MTVYTKRQQRACELIQKTELDAAAFVPGAQFTYLTGIHLHLMERPTLYVLAADGTACAVMPKLERLKWSLSMPDVETFYWDDADGPAAAFALMAKAIGCDGALGVEGLRMRFAEQQLLAAHWSAEQIINADEALAELRILKDESEIASLRKAISISEAALGETLDFGITGQTERQFVARLKGAMLSHGATGFSFDPIVLTAGKSANPHGEPGDEIIAAGQPLLIDFGASFEELNADITRTFFCGHVTDKHAEIYETVRQANEAGRAAVKAGNKIGLVDAAATDVLKVSAFDDLILHKTGHGLGREVHEAPWVMRSNEAPQRAGMVFTIEPGLYREGEIGVRIEDDVVVTETGIDCLTSFNRELTIYA